MDASQWRDTGGRGDIDDNTSPRTRTQPGNQTNTARDPEPNRLEEARDLLRMVSNNLNIKEEEAPRQSIAVLV